MQPFNVTQLLFDDSSSVADTSPGRTRLIGTLAGIGNNCNNMIGVGIFSSPGLVLSEIKSPGIALILWLVGGIAALFGSLSYLGSSIPEGGGETVYLKRAFPRPRALFSYMFSFSMIVAIRPASICAISNIFAQYFLYLINPIESSDYLHPTSITSPNFWRLRICSLAAVLIITIYHILSNKWANFINQTLTIIKILTLLVLTIAGLATIHQSINDKDTNWKNMFPSVQIEPRGLTSALILILFAYNGWNNLNYTLDEFVNPKEKLVRSNSISVVVVTFLYLCANIAYTNVPLKEITGKSEPYEIIAVRFALQVGNSAFASAVSFFICLSAFGTLAANTWAGSRVIVAAAKRNYFPFSSWFQKWNNKTDTPVFALIAQAVWCSLIIIFYQHNDPYQFFTKLSQHCVWIFLFLSALGLLFLRYTKPNLPRPFRVFTIIPIIFILFALFIIFASFKQYSSKTPYDQFDYNIAYYVSFAVVGVSAIFWLFLYSLGCKLRFEPESASRPRDDSSSHISLDDGEKRSIEPIPMEVTKTNDTFDSRDF
ncbi:10437_t:CDS:2 [Ambispora gerdemannii]|uniref:10437_t:CDS:1 n=1 Tax=Ambispora gerdemannii TaxID=144530 RepID=A0A9N8Z6F0_9GLOM|nr:10437_t:CDS:2 [Ambispora gerdemannii]